MVVVALVIDGDTISNDVLRGKIGPWENMFGICPFEVYVDNRNNQYGGQFHTGEDITFSIDSVVMFRGVVDDVYTKSVGKFVDRKSLYVTGRCRAVELGDISITKRYPHATVDPSYADDVIDDALTEAGVSITYTSVGLAPEVAYPFKRSKLQPSFREIAEMVEYDAYVDFGVTPLLHFFKSGDPGAHTSVDLVSDTEGTNNILRISEGEEIGGDVKNHLTFHAGPVKDHWTENASDWNPYTDTAITDEYTLKQVGGISSIKASFGSTSDHKISLDFPRHNYVSLDFTKAGEAMFACWHENHVVDVQMPVRPFLEDGNGNVIEYVKYGRVDTEPGSTELIDVEYWHWVKFPLGEEQVINGAPVQSGYWGYTTIVDSFDWSDVVKFGVICHPPVPTDEFDLYVDYLKLPSTEAVSIVESAASQALYGKKMHNDYMANMLNQKSLDDYAEAFLEEHKWSIATLHLHAHGQTGSRYPAESLDVRIGSHGISTLTKYRILELTHYFDKDGVEGFSAETFVTEYELLLNDQQGEFDEPVSSRRMSLRADAVSGSLRILRRFNDRIAEATMEDNSNTFVRTVNDSELGGYVTMDVVANLPVTGDYHGQLYYATDVGIWFGWNEGLSQWDELSRAEVKTRLNQLLEKDHDSVDSVDNDDHHNRNHDNRHETGSADDIATVSDGSHNHDLSTYTGTPTGSQVSGSLPQGSAYSATRTTGKVIASGSLITRYCSASNGGPTDTAFKALSSAAILSSSSGFLVGAGDGWIFSSYSPATVSHANHTHLADTTTDNDGSHTHDVSASPTPDAFEAEDGEELIEILVDEDLDDGHRLIRVNYPDFNNLYFDIKYPPNTTDESIIKDLKYNYHAMWTQSKRKAKETAEGKPRKSLIGKLKWDRDDEELYMKTKREATYARYDDVNWSKKMKKGMVGLFEDV